MDLTEFPKVIQRHFPVQGQIALDGSAGVAEVRRYPMSPKASPPVAVLQLKWQVKLGSVSGACPVACRRCGQAYIRPDSQPCMYPLGALFLCYTNNKLIFCSVVL